MRTLRPELLDELLRDYETPADLLGEAGLFRDLKKALLERAPDAELSAHLGYDKHVRGGGANSRNVHSRKTVLAADGPVTLKVPRDRDATFEPVLVPKGATRLPGFDEQVISLYARGLTVREVKPYSDKRENQPGKPRALFPRPEFTNRGGVSNMLIAFNQTESGPVLYINARAVRVLSEFDQTTTCITFDRDHSVMVCEPLKSVADKIARVLRS